MKPTSARRLAWVLAACLLWSGPVRATSVKSPTRFDLVAGPLQEVSGCAFSKRTADVVWLHNDSGDVPRVFALDLAKRTVRPVRVTGAEAVDWEDMASAPDGTLVIGDIGDNNAQRDNVTVYRIPEPTRTDRSVPATARILRYDDGPHDAEALVVDPTDGSVFVITKEAEGPSKVFVAEGETLRSVGAITLDEGGFLFPNRITGADALADGSGVVFRTYQSGYLLRRGKGGAWRTAFDAKPEPFELPAMIQGESICARANARSVLTTSESRGSMKIPFAITPVPK